MYKRRRRRTGNAGPKKGKKSSQASSPILDTESSMSVSTMEAGPESHLNYGHGHHGHHRQPLPHSTITIHHQMTNHASSKAVGARKRKPTQISKIVDKPCSENENELTDEGSGNGAEAQEEDLVSTNNNNNNNNNSPPYKKPCLLQVESKKNGMIRNIVTELKSAKEASSKLDLYLNLQQAPPGHTSETNSEDEDSLHLHIEEDGDDEEDEEQEQPTRRRQSLRGNEVAKVSGPVRQRTSSSSSPNPNQKKRKAHHENNNSLSRRNSRNSVEKVDLANIKTLLSHHSTNHTYQATKESNGWASEEDEEEGVDLRNVLAGNVIIDEDDAELPFRCGGCSYASCDRNVLLRHMKSHKGERPFQCRLCFFAFTTKANCERHLRNRHGQIDKDQVRNLVVCLPSSSNASESEPETKSGDNGSLLPVPIIKNVNATSGGGLVLQQKQKASMLAQQNLGLLDFSSTGPGFGLSNPMPSTSLATSLVIEDDLPLDLSMDAVDLSTKNRHNAFVRPNNSLLRPRPLYPTSDGSNLVTSPFVSKREPMVHPQLSIPLLSPEGHFNGMFTNGYSPFTHPIRSSDLNGNPTPIQPPFSSLFPFGGPSPYNPFNLPTPNMEKLLSLNRPKSPPSKLTSGFMAPSPNASFGSRDSLTNSVEKEIKVDKSEMKHASEPKSSSVSSGSPTTSSRKRSDTKNGEYQKPKQRRYRTERPFACPHCPARFTLRSNMERHGKHQHPTVWQRSPSNRVINRQQKNQQSPLVGPPTLVHPNKYSSSNGIDGLDFKPTGKGHRNNPSNNHVDGLANVDVRAVIARQLKRKLSNSNIQKSLLNGGGGTESGTETESDTNTFSYSEGKSGPDSSDLASVSQLLDRVKNSNIAQYFHDPGTKSVNTESEEERSSGESSDEGGDTEDGTEPETKDKAPSSGREKKKSAYSSAPHKISCPHCSRRFPWTSSLRRHLLTHTGQKPYQCSSCPLLFTTKSNCDRHLARKHNGKPLKSGNNSTEDEDEDADDGCEADEDQDEAEQDEQDLQSTPVAPDSVTPAGPTSSKTSSPSEDVAFRCHLCEASAGEREVLLTHMEEDHKETFQVLISKGALTSSPPSENSEAEQIPLDHKEASHRKVVCVFCVRRFWSVEDLRRHIRSHSGERPFSCPHCSRRFTLKHSMLRHLKKHASEDSQQTPKSRRDKQSKLSSKLVMEAEANSQNSDDAESDLIGRLLGINDESLVEKLLNKPDAKDAAKLLGLRMGLARHHTSVTASTN